MANEFRFMLHLFQIALLKQAILSYSFTINGDIDQLTGLAVKFLNARVLSSIFFILYGRQSIVNDSNEDSWASMCAGLFIREMFMLQEVRKEVYQ